MDLRKQNFGALLFSLDNEDLKKKMRNIEKMNKRLIHIKSGINLNDIYIYMNFEKFTYITKALHTPSSPSPRL